MIAKRKKLFWLDIGEGCIGIVASNTTEARRFARNYEFYSDTFESYIDMAGCLSLARNNKVDVSGLPLGEVEFEAGLRSGVYGFVTEYPCERCNHELTCSLVGDKILCGECEQRVQP